MSTPSATYLEILQALLPPGAAWPRDPKAVLTAVLGSFADGLAKVDSRAHALLDEADPRTAFEMLGEWETEVGLPDPCTGVPETVSGRQRLVHARWTATGGQSRAYFTDLAATLGYTITITEHRQYRCESTCTDPLDPPPWHHVYEVNAPTVTANPMLCIGGCDEPLRTWGNQALECALTRLAPAHALVRFVYGE